MVKFILFYITFLPLILFSQIKGDYMWLGGYQYDGTEGYKMNFNNKNPTPEFQGLRYGFSGNNTSICDDEGNLLFYFNGCAVMNRLHQVMPNGDSINAGEWFDKFWKGDCKYGYPGFQDVLILDDPGMNNRFYLFHKSNIYNQGQNSTRLPKVSYLDMNLNNFKGEVIYKNRDYYFGKEVMYSYLTSIKHQNQNDWWIIQPLVNDSSFLTYLLDGSGIGEPVFQNTHQYFDDYRSSAGGTAKFSPDGTKYALYNYVDQLHIYDFDRATGLLSNHQKIEIFNPDSIDLVNNYFSSVEWSPNSRFVYCASYIELHQVDTWEADPQDGVRHIADYDRSLDPFPNELFLMAQAPDCKIYMVSKNGSYSLHVIKKPNELGTNCDFVQHGIKLPNSHSGTLPNFPRFRVDEGDKCDPTITSVFGDAVYYRRDMLVYPNPSSGLFTIKLPESIGKANMVVTNINGQILYQRAINNTILEEIDITHLPAGRYNIEIYPTDSRERVFYGEQVVKI